MLLFLLAMGTFFDGAEDAWDIDEIVLAVSAAIDGDLIDDTGDNIGCVVTDGDLIGCIGCIGNCSCC